MRWLARPAGHRASSSPATGHVVGPAPGDDCARPGDPFIKELHAGPRHRERGDRRRRPVAVTGSVGRRDVADGASKFTGKYEHRVVEGGIGHNLPQEAPQDFAEAIIAAASY